MLLKEAVEHLKKKATKRRCRFWSHANLDARENGETACMFDQAQQAARGAVQNCCLSISQRANETEGRVHCRGPHNTGQKVIFSSAGYVYILSSAACSFKLP